MGWTREQAQAYGKKGGARTVERYGTEHMQALGRKGWQAMVAKHGHAVLSINGKKGFAVTATRYFGGDKEALVRWLRDAALAAIDPVPHNGAWPRRRPWPAARHLEPPQP
jgi:hypothetical protein